MENKNLPAERSIKFSVLAFVFAAALVNFLFSPLDARAANVIHIEEWDDSSYSSKDDFVKIETDTGKITLDPEQKSFTHNITQFNENWLNNPGSFENVEISGSSIKLKDTFNDPFATSLGDWNRLPSIPRPDRNTAYARLASGGSEYIYMLFATGDGKSFARLNITDQTESNRRWEFLEPLPVPAGAGAALVSDGQDVYVLRGLYSKQVYRYIVATNTWQALPNITIPEGVGGINRGSCMVNVGGVVYQGSGKIYVVAGGGKNNFYSLSYNSGTGNFVWTNENGVNYKGTNISVSEGSSLAYPGGAYLYYILKSGSNSYILKYHMTNKQWTDLNLPADFSLAVWSSLDYPGAGVSHMYLRTDEKFYRIGTDDSITRLNDLPFKVEGQAVMYHSLTGAGQLHFFSGMHYTSPWRYDTANQKWITMTSPAFLHGNGHGYAKDLYYPGFGNFLYYITDYSNKAYFYKYDMSTNKWTGEYVPTINYATHYGSRLTYAKYNNQDSLFLLAYSNTSGSNTTFYRYDMQTGIWEPKQSFPNIGEHGSSIIGLPASAFGITGQPNKYYILGFKASIDTDTYNTARTYVYDPETNNWSTTSPATGGSLVNPPSTLRAPNATSDWTDIRWRGSSLVYPGTGSLVYITVGYSRTGLATYNAASNSWALLNYPNPALPNFSVYTVSSPLAYIDLGAEGKFIYFFSAYPTSAGHGYRVARYCLEGGTNGTETFQAGNWYDFIEPTPFYGYLVNICSVPSGPNMGIYALSRYFPDFYKYDFSIRQWSDSVIDRDFSPTKAQEGNIVPVVYNNKKYIYLFQGNTTDWPLYSHFWVYSVDSNRWEGLIRAPFKLAAGSKAAYSARSAALYALKGCGSNKLYKYTLSNMSWQEVPNVVNLPRIWRGTQMKQVEYGANPYQDFDFLMIPGYSNGIAPVYKYNVDQEGSFTQVTTLSLGEKYTYNSNNILECFGGRIYYLETYGSDNNKLFVYNIASGNWESAQTVSDGTVTSLNGAALFHYKKGADDYMLVLPGSGTDQVLRCKITAGGLPSEWQLMKSSPYTLTDSTSCFAGFDDLPYSFFFTPGSYDHLVRYYPGPDSDHGIANEGEWDELKQPPMLSWDSAICAYKGFIYVLYADNFFRYNTDTDSWEELAKPTMFSMGSNERGTLIAAEWKGQLNLYATSGSNYSKNFYKYSVAQNAWSSIGSPSMINTWGYGQTMAWDGNRYIYAIAGSGAYDAGGTVPKNKAILRFDLQGSSWTELAVELPKPVSGIGTSLVFKNNYMYVMINDYNNYSSDLYRINTSPSMGSWEPMTRPPIPSIYSHSTLMYPGFGGYFYLLQGSAYYESAPNYSGVFLKYNDEINPTNPWQEVTNTTGFNSMPTGIAVPGNIFYTGGNYVYSLTGRDYYNDILIPYGQRPSLFKSPAFTFGTYISDIEDDPGVHSSWGSLTWTGNSRGKAVRIAMRTGNESNLSDAEDWNDVLDLKFTGTSSSASASLVNLRPAIKETDKFAQYKISFATDSLESLPEIWQIGVTYNKFPLKQQLYSKVFNGTSALNRIVNMDWKVTYPTGDFPPLSGTGIRLQLKSAPSSSIADGIGFIGPDETKATLYNFTDLRNYVTDPNIEIIEGADGKAQLKNTRIFSNAITLTNNNAVDLKNYQVKVEINSSMTAFWQYVQKDGSDVRFSDSDKATRLSYWIESFTFESPTSSNNSAVIWVKVPLISASSAKTIYLYYGNKMAITESSYENTMGIPDNDPGLVSSWHFDEGSGSKINDTAAIDTSISKNSQYHGSINGSAEGYSWVDGKFGKGLMLFNRSANTISVSASSYPFSSQMNYQDPLYPGVSSLTNYQFTISSWVKVPRGPTGQLFLSLNNGSYPNAYLNGWSTGGPILYLNSDSGYSYYNYCSISIADDKWHHLVYVMDEASYPYMKFYVDGVYRSSGPSVYGEPPRGKYISSSWRFGPFLGTMDEVKVYNRVLSQSEIQAHYQNRVYAPIPVSYSITAVPQAENVFEQWQFRQQAEITYTISKDRKDQAAILKIDPAGNPYLMQYYADLTAGSANIDGRDIRISDGYPMSYEYKMLHFNRSTQEAKIYVKFPFLKAGNNAKCTVYIYYGNASAPLVDPPLKNFALQEGLKGYWAFEDVVTGNPQVLDSTDNAFNGTIQNNVTSNASLGKVGKCVQLANATTVDYIRLVDPVTLGIRNKDFTVSAWVRFTGFPADVNGISTIVGSETATSDSNKGLVLGIQKTPENNRSPYMSFVNNDTLFDGKNLNANQWYHIVYRYTSAGQEQAIIVNANPTDAVYSPGHNAFLGNFISGQGYDKITIGRGIGGNPLKGYVDEVYVYDRSLSIDEIERLYAVGSFTSSFLPSETNSQAKGFSVNDPVLQPILGIYYDKDNYKLFSFEESAYFPNGRANANIKYQFSFDGWKWYWYDNTTSDGDPASGWEEATGGYLQANEAVDINALALQNFHDVVQESGDFYFRAYMHSASGNASPELYWVKIRLNGAETFYTDPTGNIIDSSQSDADSDRYFKYKVILYSDGANAPILDYLNLSYATPYINITSPQSGDFISSGVKRKVTWNWGGLKEMSTDTGKINLWYASFNGTDYDPYVLINPTPIDVNSTCDGGATARCYEWDVPNFQTVPLKLRATSAQADIGTKVASEVSNLMTLPVELIYPNGAERLELNRETTIRFKVHADNVQPTIYFILSTDGGATFPSPENRIYTYTYSNATRGQELEVPWTIPNEDRFLSDNCRIKILGTNTSGQDVYDVSNANFKIVPMPEIVLKNPAPGFQTSLVLGKTLAINWTSKGNIDYTHFAVQYRPYGCSTCEWTDITANLNQFTHDFSGGSAQWTPSEADNIVIFNKDQPDPVRLEFKVGETEKRTGYEYYIEDICDNLQIKPPYLNLKKPDDGTIWVAGDTTRVIEWERDGATSGNLSVEYSIDGGASWQEPAIFSFAPGPEELSGSFIWSNIPLEAALDPDVTLIRIRDSHQPSSVASLPRSIKILPKQKLELITPSRNLLNGELYKVQWRWYGDRPLFGLLLELSVNNGTDWDVVPPTTYSWSLGERSDTGEHQWPVPEVETEEAILRLRIPTKPEIDPSYSSAFVITVPTITLTAPVEADVFANGQYTFAWEFGGDVGQTLTLQYRLIEKTNDNALTDWQVISATAQSSDNLADPNVITGHFGPWRVPFNVLGINSADKRIEVRAFSNKWITGGIPKVISPSKKFNVVNPGITSIISPSTGDTGANAWVIGTEHPIVFGISPNAIASGAISKFAVKYSNKNFGAAQPLESDYLPEPILVVNSNDPAIKNNGALCETTWEIPAEFTPTNFASIMVLVYFNDTDYITTTPFKYFGIALPNVKITTPVGAEIVRVGTVYKINWYYLGAVQFPIRIHYSYVNSNTWAGEGTGLIAEYLTPNDLPTDKITTPQGGVIYRTEWDTYHEGNIPHQAWLKVEDNGFAMPYVTDPFIIDKPKITLTEIPGVFSVTENIDIVWDIQGKLKGPVEVRWARDNFAAGGLIETIPVEQANTKKTSTWTVDEDAYSNNNTLVFVKDLGFNTSGATPTFNVFPRPVINVIAPAANAITRIGGTYPVTWEKDCSTTRGICGKTSNNFKITYSDSNGKSFIVTPSTTFGQQDQWTYPLYVDPLQVVNPAVSASVTVQDNSPWKTIPTTEHKIVSSSNFEVKMPKITMNTPSGGEYWAIGDKPEFSWSTEGAISAAGLTIECNAAGTNYLVSSGQTANGTYSNWSVPVAIGGEIPVGQDSIVATVKIYDTKQYTDPVDGQQKTPLTEISPINILREAKIDNVSIQRPGDTSGNKVFVLEEPVEISWVPKGLAIKNVKIRYYSASANPRVYNQVIAKTENDGYFLWTSIPVSSLVGSDLVLEIIGLNDSDAETTIKGVMAGTFKIRGGLVLQPLSADNKILAKATPDINNPNVTWTTLGSIDRVTLKYRFEGDTDWTVMQDASGRLAENINNTGGFNWAVPDLPQARIEDQSYIQRFSMLIYHHSDPVETRNQRDNNEIVYCYVVWKIFDNYTYSELSDVVVEEKQVNDDGSTVPRFTATKSSGFYGYYPYGKYLDSFSKNDYLAYSESWVCEVGSMPPKEVYLENKILAQTQWSVKVTPNYTVTYDSVNNTYTDNLNINAWLEKRGKLVGLVAEEMDKFNGSTIEIYKDGVLLDTMTQTSASNQPNTSGVFVFNWTNPQLTTGSSYFIKAKIRFEEFNRVYEHVSGASFDVNSQVGNAINFGEQLQELKTQSGITQGLITNAAQEIKTKIDTDVIPAVTKAKTDIVTAVTTEASKILSATETRVIPAIESTKQEVTTIKKSAILNRENTVRNGQSLTIRYRTYAGVSPTIQVYDANNLRRLSGGMVTSANEGDTSIYEYVVTFENSWGRGDFTVVCSESAHGSIDAMIISVIRADLEQVAGNVSAIMGTTSGISTLKDVADSLNSQFSVIETALSQVGKSLVKDAKEAASSGKAMENIYSQINSIAGQIKQMVGKTTYNIDKLYSVNAGKKQDITYLKNKTQQLKATMDINTKMIDNIANKPITQTWFEYR